MTTMFQRSWARALAGGIPIFLFALAACAARDWHAPNGPTIALLYLLGMGIGVSLCLARMRSPLDGARELQSRTTNALPIVLATLSGAATAALGALLVATIINDWHSRILASFIGALWMATYPLHPVLFQLLYESDVTVGTDGVRIGRKLVPFSMIRRAVSEEREITVELMDGSKHVFTLPNNVVALTLAHKMAQRRAAFPKPAMLARGKRAFTDWKRELLADDYRSSKVSRDEAATIASGGNVTKGERIGAAIVLAAAGDRDRVRVIAEDCLDPSLKRALLRVADDTLDEDTMAEIERTETAT